MCYSRKFIFTNHCFQRACLIRYFFAWHGYEILGHPSLFGDKERKLIFYYSEPDKGVNEETGILLIIAGFGGNANSNVYKKMRNTFADKYNLLTIQC